MLLAAIISWIAYAELGATAVGQRVFDVDANSQAALLDFDIFQEAGLHESLPSPIPCLFPLSPLSRQQQVSYSMGCPCNVICSSGNGISLGQLLRDRTQGGLTPHWNMDLTFDFQVY